ncbi:MAG: hypothetical protein IJD71_01085 [Clostridia bacterium]|nr:hypothetical protein [Clostridia bacterium]
MITIIDPLKLPALNFKDEFLSAKIKANFLSYGGDCSFLFLWCQKSNQDITAIICKFEQSVIIVASDDADFGEIKDFLNVVGFSSIQASPVVFKRLGLDYTEYQVVFKASELGGTLPPMPNLKEVYDILFSEENPHIKKVPFDSFYVDLCHRIRHNTAAAVLNHSSVCIASHITNDAAVISGVATKKNSRKTGSGSEALISLCKNLDGRKIFAAAEESVVPFYIKNGFKACGKTTIYSIKE